MRSILLIIIAAVVVAAIVAVAYVALGGSSKPVVQSGDNVSVYYTGTFTNGTVFNTNVGQQPFVFTAGSDEVIKGFSSAVIGMELNQTKTVTIPYNEAYGPVNPELIIEVPVNEFGNQTIDVGNIITETSYQTGQQAQGLVTAVNSTSVTVDFNSPLAGKTLVFTIHVVGISK